MNFGREDYNDFIKKVAIADEEKQLILDSDEPVFLIRGSDPLGPKMMLDYAGHLMSESIDNYEVAQSVIEHAQRMIDWQRVNGTKNADLDKMNQSKISKIARIEEILTTIEIDEKLSGADFDEIQTLTEEVYGNGSFLVLNPNEFEIKGGIAKYTINNTKIPNLILGVTPLRKWIIIHKDL